MGQFFDIVDQIVVGIDNVNQLKFNILSLKKKIDTSIFKEALEIEFLNEKNHKSN